MDLSTALVIILIVFSIIVVVLYNKLIIGSYANTLSPLATLIYSLFLLFIVHEVKVTHYEKYGGDREENISNIISLSSETNTEGGFILGSGYIEGVFYYTMYEDTPNGYIRREIRGDNTFIVETSDREPSTVDIIKGTKGSYFYNNTYSHTIIYVPEGTIIRKFKL